MEDNENKKVTILVEDDNQNTGTDALQDDAPDNSNKLTKPLKWLSIEDVWGIGRRYARKLQAMGVKTAYDFTQFLQGVPSIEMEVPEKKQSIATTRSFDRDYSTFEDLRERISTFTMMSAGKLREQKSMCQRLVVFIETNRFNEKEDFYSNSILLKLPFPTSSSLELVNFAVNGLKGIFRENKHYKRAGVILMDFVDANEYQPSLFFNSNPKHKNLMEAVDKLNSKYGKTLVRLASQDELMHKMRRRHLSKAYTTNFDELIEINI